MSDKPEEPLSECVTVKVAAPATGLSQKAIRRKIETGVWIEGFQYHRRGGSIFIDLKGYERWVRGASI